MSSVTVNEFWYQKQVENDLRTKNLDYDEDKTFYRHRHRRRHYYYYFGATIMTPKKKQLVALGK